MIVGRFPMQSVFKQSLAKLDQPMLRANKQVQLSNSNSSKHVTIPIFSKVNVLQTYHRLPNY